MNEQHTPQFTGWYIPVELRTQYKLSFMQCILWATVYSLSRNTPCFASNEYLCESLGIKKSVLGSHLKVLTDLGLIQVIAFDGRRRQMQAIYPHPEKSVQSLPENRNAASRKNGSLNTEKTGAYNIEYSINNNIDDRKEKYKKEKLASTPKVAPLFPDEPTSEQEFEKLWKLYPQEGRVSKAAAKEIFLKALQGKGKHNKKIEPPKISEVFRALAYYKHKQSKRIQDGFALNISTFLNSQPWLDVPDDFNEQTAVNPNDPFATMTEEERKQIELRQLLGRIGK